MKKIAIIGASEGQLLLVKKAREMGLYVICFAWEKGAVCKDVCDEFFPISIYDYDRIIEQCMKSHVDGVVSIASEETAKVVSIVADKLGFKCTPPNVMAKIQNKKISRELTKDVKGLTCPKTWSINELETVTFPCVVKPITGSAKRGVCYCDSSAQLESAVNYARNMNDEILIEEYISGKEYSVECLSYDGKHQIAQISRKINTGFPHFVETEVHQPANLSSSLRLRIEELVSNILSAVGYTNGASHVEIKVDNEKIYLIEVNPRGAGDRTADTLVSMSTDCDFLAEVINIAMDNFQFKDIHNIAYSGILFLSKQSSYLLKYFEKTYEWVIECHRWNKDLSDSTTNYERDGFLIYKSLKPVIL